MGFLSKVLEKAGILVEEKETSRFSAAEEVHVYELVEWLDKHAKAKIQQHALPAEFTEYQNKLKDQHWVLESKQEQWKLRLKSSQGGPELAVIYQELLKSLQLLIKVESFDKVIPLHQHVELLWEKMLGKLETVAGTAGGDTEIMVKLTELLHEVKAQKDAFEQKITQSGYRNIHTLTQKAQTIEQHSEHIKKLQAMKQQREEKLKEVQEKKLEREQDLQQLQQSMQFTDLHKIREQRTKLLQDMQKAENPQWRSELRQQLDALERVSGNRDLLMRYDDLQYRLDHFKQQEQRLQEELSIVQENLQDSTGARDKHIELFTNLSKISLGKEVGVKV